jgi:hypothetical protein
MRTLKLFLLAALLAFIAPRSSGDKLQTGSITVLPGYQIEFASHAIDSFGGKISKQGGLTIYYDNLLGAGTRTDDPALMKKTRWRNEQILDGHKVVLVLTKDDQLTISFPDWQANFFAKVRSPQEMAEVLLIVLTYRSGSDAAKTP